VDYYPKVPVKVNAKTLKHWAETFQLPTLKSSDQRNSELLVTMVEWHCIICGLTALEALELEAT